MRKLLNRFIINHPNQLKQIILYMLELLKDNHVFALTGEIGAGKTTLVRHFIQYLDTSQNVTSPTFPIIKFYETPKYNIFHMDLYRVKNNNEFFELGGEEILDNKNNICFIEWANKIPTLEKLIQIDICIQVITNNQRIFDIFSTND